MDSTEYVSAAAIAPGYKLSYLASGVFNMVAANPVMSTPPGSYSGAQSIALSTITPNAAVFYTTDGSTPTTQSTAYTGPIVMNATGTIKAIAGRKGYANSALVTATYSIGATSAAPPENGATATPTISPVGGSFTSAQTVTIADATSGAAIYYTTDGTTPNALGVRYAGPITVSNSETVKAVAIASGFTASAADAAAFVISATAAPTSLVPFSSGFGTGQIYTNGSAVVKGTTLQLTTGQSAQQGSAFYPSTMSTASFTTDFDFQLPSSVSDGFTFTLQNYRKGYYSLGLNASGLGYQTIGNSVAVAFGLFQAGVSGAETLGVYTGGVSPQGSSISLVGTGINLHNGNVVHTHIVYAGSSMAVTLTDESTGATVTENFPIDVVDSLGSSTGYVGFTGSTGAFTSVQNILNWSYWN